MRTLFSRNHATVYPGKGIFLAGPTPPDGEMLSGWRRQVIEELNKRHKIRDDVIVVSPEPEDGKWKSIISRSGSPNENSENDQIAWELQYLDLCDITVFWLPVYWDEKHAGNFPANIGPTTRWEFGLMLEKYLNSPTRRKFILGGPEDAQSVGWARHVAKHYNIPWHTLESSNKQLLVSDSFVDAIAESINS